MFSKIVWCYVLILTLLDISPNTYLSAQGKSHDNINIHDTLVEGVTFQEWGAESGGDAAEGPVRLVPAALRFGRVPLAAPRAALVTLINRGNTTLHLASVAGTTPDFHASFFHSKTVPPDGNTTFSVVYLGRREGPVAAHLYIHTSLGVHKYPVSAVGEASPFEVWPLLSLRVPLNATLGPLLTLANPTDSTIQIREVYSSGAWVGLQLPAGEAGEGGAGAAHWRLPPRSRRPLVRLRVAPPPAPAATAYIRIKANVSLTGEGGEGAGGGGLVVAVEASRAPPGEHAEPPHVRLRVRGSLDPDDTVEISLGNSGPRAVRVRAGVWAARCLPAPHHPPPPSAPSAPPPAAPPPAHAHANGGSHSEQTDRAPWGEGGEGEADGDGAGAGAGDGAAEAGGVRVAVLQRALPPRSAPAGAAATLTLHYGKMWAEYSSASANGRSHAADGNGAGAGAGAAGGGDAWCAGWVRLGAAALPYSVRLLPGTLALQPAALDIVTAAGEAGEHHVVAHNQFSRPLYVAGVTVPPAAAPYLQVEAAAGTLAAGARAPLAVLRLRPGAGALPPLAAALTVHTNVSAYALPVRVYSGLLRLEWEWPRSADGTLRAGALGAGSRRVRARLRNPAPAALPLRRARLALPGAAAALAVPRCPACLPGADCHCLVCAGCELEAWLTIAAGARPGPAQGTLWLHTPHGASAHPITLTAYEGRVAVLPLALPPAAPYAWSSAELVVESSMALRMRVTELVSEPPDPALSFQAGEHAEFSAGRWAVGRARYAPERLCAPRCYAGLPPGQPETAAWLARAAGGAEGALRADAALAAARWRLFQAGAAPANGSLLLHTTQVVQLRVAGWAGGPARAWPRLAAPGGARAGLAAVRARAPLRLPLRNPSRSHALLLQPALLAAPLLPPPLNEEGETTFCQKEKCVLSDAAFALKSWRTLGGEAREWQPGAPDGGGADAAGGAPEGRSAVLLLAPAAEIELELEFTPHDALPLATYLYLRNNLTVVESVQLAGRGAAARFELAGRAPGDAAPLALEVTECSGRAERSLVLRNTGRVPLRLRDWRVGGPGEGGEGGAGEEGAPCAARGFRLQPCAPLLLAPNATRALTLAFTADWTLARAAARLSARGEAGRHEFLLGAAVPARLRAACAPRAARPPFERPLRSAARLLALAALALALALAALDAERLLRRARAPPRPAARAPLDLRALAAPRPAPPAPPAAPAPPPPRRRRARKPDPLAESRAFERWRASLRRADDDSERSSEDDDDVRPAGDAPPDGRGARDSPPPADEPPRAGGDDDAASTGSDTSTGASTCSPTEAEDADPSPPAEGAPPGERAHSPPRAAPDGGRPEPSAAPPGASASEERAARRTEPSPRRSRRADAEPAVRARAALLKHHARKEKSAKRRERAPPGAPRASPAGGAGGPGGAAGGAGDARPVSGGVRVGASWSSVVARREPAAAPPPVGADRRAAPARPAPAPPQPAPAADNSLFYFNGEAARAAPLPERDFAWRADPPSDVAGFAPPARDYLGGGSGAGESGAFGNIGPVLWGDSLAARAPGAAWPWGFQPPVRPPPGFGAAGAGAGRGAVRAFDPFHSLASIWSRGALDWRGDDDRPRE